MEMEAAAAAVVRNLDDVCDTLRRLPEIVASFEGGKGAADAQGGEDPAGGRKKKKAPPGNLAPMAKAESDALYVAGSRVKFLVDTPEKIWGSLEEREYLGAARRFLAARDVLECLESTDESGAAAEEHARHVSTAAAASDAEDIHAAAPPAPLPYAAVAKHFPLVRQQGPLLGSFQAQIAARARAGLETPGLSPRAAASALAAVIAVEGLSGEEALRLLLQTKRAWLRASLRRVGRGAAPGKVAAALARCLAEVRHVVTLLWRCFVGGVGSAEMASSPIQAKDRPETTTAPESLKDGGGDIKVLVSDPGAPLPFAALREDDPQGTTFAGVSHPARETARWSARVVEVFRGALTAPSAATVRDAAREWLEGCASDVEAAADRGLLAGVTRLADLADLERDVCRTPPTREDAARLEEETTAAVVVTGRPLDAWSALVSGPFVARAKALLAEVLSHAPLLAALDDALATTPPPAPRDTPSQPSPEALDAWGVDTSSGVDDDRCRPPAPPLTRRATALAAAMAAALTAARTDALALAGVSTPGAAVPRGGRLAQLEPFIHAECHAGVAAVATRMSARLAELEAEAAASGADAAVRASAVERALLVAQTAQDASTHAEALALLLGPAAEWNPGAASAAAARTKSRRHFFSGGGGRGGGARGDAATGKLGEALVALRAVAARGFRLWAEHNGARAAEAMASALEVDDTLEVNETPRDWEEEKVADGLDGDEGGEGEGGATMTLRLPALPSPYVLSALHAASVEALRCGGHLLPPEALAALAAGVAEGATSAYLGFLKGAGAPGKGRVSEKGVLQMLFDMRLLVDVLAGGGAGASDGSSSSTWAAGAAARAMAAAAAAQEVLVEAIDPIDWATYESFLWRNERRAYQRCAVLLGLFSQLHRLHPGESTRPQTGGSTGGGAGGALPPRFSYLPVSLPAAARATVASGGGGRPAGGKLPGAIDWDVAGFDRFGAVGSSGAYEEGGSFLGKFGQGFGLGKGMLGLA